MKNKIQLYMSTGWEKFQHAITPSTSPALPLCKVQLLQIASELANIRGIHVPLCKYT